VRCKKDSKGAKSAVHSRPSYIIHPSFVFDAHPRHVWPLTGI
jgi:hypothetical protein